MTVSLKAMRYFVTVLRHGSIQRAAEELNIAASAIGTALDQVEAQVGLPLVMRQRARGVTATPSGRVLAARFERLLEEYEAVLAMGADLKEALGGTLRIGYYAPVAPAFLPAILSRIPAAPGAIHARIEACDNDAAQAGLLEGRFDVSCSSAMPRSRRSGLSPCWRRRPIALCPPGTRWPQRSR